MRRTVVGDEAAGLTAVLFVDIVDATAAAISLGDRAWAELLEDYHRIVCSALDTFAGRLIDTAGDGVFAVFDETVDAIGCALDIRSTMAQLGVELRSGVHAGHCWSASEKCAGVDVHVGARVAAAASPGEVLVSEQAAGLARRAGIVLIDRGALALKGLPGLHHVFAVVPESPLIDRRRPAGRASADAP